MDAITAVHWKKMAEESKIGWPMVRDRIRQLSQAVAEQLHSIREECSIQNPAKTAEVADIIQRRTQLFQQ